MKVIILDFETSGLNVYHDDIIEIGAKVMGTDEEFSALIKPKSNKAITEKIRKLTGITNTLLMEEGKHWEDGYGLFCTWLNNIYNIEEENIIVSHNGNNFDFILLRRLFTDIGCKINHYYFIDTLGLSKRLIKDRYSYSQSSLLKTYRIVNNSEHRALGDVKALEKLFIILKSKMEKENISILKSNDYIEYKI